jgi:hypothetical protein
VTSDCLLLSKEHRELVGVDRVGCGEGIPLHDGEGMKSGVTSLKHTCITTIKIPYSISDDLSNTDALKYNYKCSGNKLQMSLDH